jgi:hypothetical protein
MNIIKDFFNIIEYVINTPSRRYKKPYKLNISVNNIDFAKEDNIMVTMTNTQYIVLNIVPVNNRKQAVPVNGTKPVWDYANKEITLILTPDESGLSCKVESTGKTGSNTIIVETTIWLKDQTQRKIKGSLEIEIIEAEASHLLVGHEPPQEIEVLVEGDAI